jgi:hypothetical protein
MTEKEIRDCLPIPPFSHKYVVRQQSPQIWRVDLLHPMKYSYTKEQVMTIWGFIKTNGKVYPPRNSQTPRRSPLCNLDEITDDLCYSTIIPTTRTLTDD